MKKILTSILVVFTAMFALSTSNLSVRAAEELEDLYPNNDIANLQGQYGNSNWVLEFGGVRYHTVRDMARRATQFKGVADEEKTVFTGADVPGTHANAMGGLYINDLGRDIVLHEGDRTKFTGVDNRIWLTFDGEGRLTTFEDNISAYYITEVDGEDYFRLATAAEITDFEEASEDEKPANMRHTHMRMVLNEDNETYKIEPLAYLEWTNADFVPANPAEEVEESGKVSVILDRDPKQVVIEDGGFALHLSTWDRGMSNLMEWVATLPGLLASQKEKAEVKYIDPAPFFTGLSALDVNDQMEGVNVVYEFGAEPSVSNITNNIAARHVNEEQSKAGNDSNRQPKLYSNPNYKIELFEGTTLLETIDVTFDEETKKYTPSKELFEHLDTEDFGAAYTAKYSAVSPVSGKAKEEVITIDVGVLPININNVQDRIIDEGLYINPLEGLTADDNYGIDISESLSYEVDKPFNKYAPKAGTYRVTVHANYVFGSKFDASEDAVISIGDASFTVPSDFINPEHSMGDNGYTTLRRKALITEQDVFETQIENIVNDFPGSIWSNLGYVLLDDANRVAAYFNFATNKAMKQDGVEYDISGTRTSKAGRDDFLSSLTFENNYKFLAASTGAGTGDPTLFSLLQLVDKDTVFEGLPQAFDVNGSRTYNLTVNDTVSPIVTLKSKVLTIYTDSSFKDATEAALSNVNYYDANFQNVVVPGANRIDIRKPGEHDVKVVVSDEAGNSTSVDFKLVVKAPLASQDEVDGALDLVKDVEDNLKDQIEQLEQQLGQKIDDKKSGTAVWLVIVISLVTSGLSFGGAVLLLGKKQ